MKLHVLKGCPYCIRVLFQLEVLGLDYQIVWYANYDGLRTPEYYAMNPNGQAPVLEVKEGFLYESSAIMRYIAELKPEAKINGGTIYEKGLVDQWILNTGTLAPISGIFMSVIGVATKSKDELDKAYAIIPQKMKLFEDRLAGREYLVGNTVTTADFATLSLFYVFCSYFMDEKELSKYPNFSKYYKNLISQKFFTNFFGNNRGICNQPFDFVPHVEHKAEHAKQPKKEANHQKPTAAAPKQKKEEDKPEESKKPAKPEEPETTFDLFNFKTLFVNETDRKKVSDFAITEYDKNHFSFWHVRYDKHPAEGKELIPFNNLLTNFCQRLADLSLTKNIIGIHGIYGEEPDLQINGLWLWKSADFYEGLKDHPSNEYLQWTKLDPTKQEDRKRIEEYWSNIKSETGIVEGQRCRTLKIIK